MDMTGYGELDERIVAPNASHLEEQSEFTLRPQTLDEYIGQQTATDNLKVFIEAAKMSSSTDLRVWVRPHWQESLLMNWEWI